MFSRGYWFGGWASERDKFPSIRLNQYLTFLRFCSALKKHVIQKNADCVAPLPSPSALLLIPPLESCVLWLYVVRCKTRADRLHRGVRISIRCILSTVGLSGLRAINSMFNKFLCLLLFSVLFSLWCFSISLLWLYQLQWTYRVDITARCYSDVWLFLSSKSEVWDI